MTEKKEKKTCVKTGPDGKKPCSPKQPDKVPVNQDSDDTDTLPVMDNNAEDSRKTVFPIVGIGASAGGLAAFESFFSGMPKDRKTGMAFILVQHLDPDHKSILADLVRRYTSIEVFEVTDGMTVKPDCAYIIPPGCDMAFLNGALHLMEPAAPRGRRMPIDFLFRSLAQGLHERAICVVLSGTGSDGTIGLREVKGEGGMVIAQTPSSTEYEGMPLSAISTGLVDYELEPGDMPARIIAYASHAFGGMPISEPDNEHEPDNDNYLKKICILLRNSTGHDFSQYKMNTIRRRIDRRMAVHQIGTTKEYVSYIQNTPLETGQLFNDLLIGVTSFFRDREAFNALEDKAIPKLFASRPTGSLIRVWVPGCSTGEEAYSIAILLMESMEAIKRSYVVQIFATDIDSRAISAARMGRYPACIASDVSPERLARFFTVEHDGNGYRIHKKIRDMVIFSEQNVIKDPPFSKLDLISCRNLLIYMGAELQKKLIPLFHYSLNHNGFLFLGSSETTGEFSNHFAIFDRKAKLYSRKEDAQNSRRLLFDSLPHPVVLKGVMGQPASDRTHSSRKPSLREMTENTLLQHIPHACAMVNANGDILYLHGRTGMYLEPSPGEAGVNNILKMAREGLKRELTIGLQKAVASREIIRCQGIRVKTNGHFITACLSIRPVATGTAPPETPLFLVILEETVLHELPVNEGAPLDALSPDVDRRIIELKQELRAKEEYLQAANEELETSNEELKSSNEEMQSINEELQSTNEELETSKEELQSVNEELATVNSELQTKVADLSRANNDMNNLLAGTGIGTVFVDISLRILRFTPAATRIINLIPGDIGRPVGHTVSNLVGYSSMVSDAMDVLDTLIPKEKEVMTTAGSWYTMRIMPYRTTDNVIEGAVITFVDITEMKRIQESLRENDKRFRVLVENLPQLLWGGRPDGTIDYISPQYSEYTGITEALQHGSWWFDQIHEDDRDAAFNKWRRSILTGDAYRIRFRILNKKGTYRMFDNRARALRDETGCIERWIGISLDISEDQNG